MDLPLDIAVLKNRPLPNLLDKNGILQLRSSAYYDTMPWETLRLWCHNYGRYGLPTYELITWLTARIEEHGGSHTAIEIGSGSGDLAYHLGIHATDNRMQEWPDIAQTYKFMGQPVIHYPEWVEKLDALEALRKYHPKVVVASWVTEWIDPNLPPPPKGGNAWGVKETEIVATGVTYILIGSLSQHSQKEIMALPHKEYAPPFLRSRVQDNSLNRVWIWNS